MIKNELSSQIIERMIRKKTQKRLLSMITELIKINKHTTEIYYILGGYIH